MRELKALTKNRIDSDDKESSISYVEAVTAGGVVNSPLVIGQPVSKSLKLQEIVVGSGAKWLFRSDTECVSFGIPVLKKTVIPSPEQAEVRADFPRLGDLHHVASKAILGWTPCFRISFTYAFGITNHRMFYLSCVKPRYDSVSPLSKCLDEHPSPTYAATS